MNIKDLKILRFQGNEQTESKERALTGLGYIPILFFVPLILPKKTKAGNFIANQGLSMLVLLIVVSILKSILNIIPVLRILTNIILTIALIAVWLGSVVRWFLYYQNDTQTELPYSLNIFK